MNIYAMILFLGTRIIYDRAFLMQCRNSPLTKSPPPNLPNIPGITCPDDKEKKAQPQENGHHAAPAPAPAAPASNNKNGTSLFSVLRLYCSQV
jgi:hypothetical protein